MKIIPFLSLFLIAEHLKCQDTAVSFHGLKNDSVRCITAVHLLDYTPAGENYNMMKKAKVKNFMESVKACGYPYRYSIDLSDKGCTMLLPNWLDTYSICFGDDQFFISFDERNDSSANCIVLYYDIMDEQRDLFFSSLLKEKEKYDSIMHEGKTMYLFKDRRGLYVGEIFLQNKMTIAYYTNDKRLEQQLRTCILSCKFDDDQSLLLSNR